MMGKIRDADLGLVIMWTATLVYVVLGLAAIVTLLRWSLT